MFFWTVFVVLFFEEDFPMKKFFSLMVIAALSVTMVGCGDKKPAADPKAAPATTPAADPAKPADAPMGK